MCYVSVCTCAHAENIQPHAHMHLEVSNIQSNSLSI